jgi:DnaK suppressor protein
MSGERKTDRTGRSQMLREMLSRIQDETRRRINDLRRDQEQEFDSEAVHVMDYASTIAEMETRAGFARAEEKLRYIDEAMARLGTDKYGSCLKCGGAISIERLVAIPFASYCANCQKQLNRERGGWGHEPYDCLWNVPEDTEPSTKRATYSAPEQQLTISEGEPFRSGGIQK